MRQPASLAHAAVGSGPHPSVRAKSEPVPSGSRPTATPALPPGPAALWAARTPFTTCRPVRSASASPHLRTVNPQCLAHCRTSFSKPSPPTATTTAALPPGAAAAAAARQARSMAWPLRSVNQTSPYNETRGSCSAAAQTRSLLQECCPTCRPVSFRRGSYTLLNLFLDFPFTTYVYTGAVHAGAVYAGAESPA